MTNFLRTALITSFTIVCSANVAAHAQTLPPFASNDDIDTLTRKLTEITQIAGKQSASDYEELGMWAMEKAVETCIASAVRNSARALYCVQYDAYAGSYDRLVPRPLRLPYFAEATAARRRQATLEASFVPSSAKAVDPMLTAIFLAEAKAATSSNYPPPNASAVSSTDKPGAPPPASPRQFDDPPTVEYPDWLRRPTAEQVKGEYPQKALSLDQQGRVELACQVELSGAVTQCSVARETPTGFGFGEAAIKVTRYMRMKPKTVDGVPEISKVTIPVSFGTY